jgi:hypothetical protein
MKRLLLSTALAVIGFATAARAGSVTIGDLTITQIAAQNTNAFNNVPVGASDFIIDVCNAAPAGCVETTFTNGTVANATSPGASVPPYGYTSSNYMYGGIAPGATGTFAAPVTDFDIYWGWIGASINPASLYDDVLTAHTGNGAVTITGSDLVVVGSALSPPVLGYGGPQPGNPPANASNDNQWFNISDSDPTGIIGFTASSSTGDPFEFGMAGVPEPSTWALMLLGFAGLGFAGYRRARAGHAALIARTR